MATLNLPAGVTVRVAEMKYDTWYPFLNGEPNKTVTYDEDFLIIVLGPAFTQTFDEIEAEAKAGMQLLLTGGFPEAAPVVKLFLDALQNFVDHLMKDQYGVSLWLAPHYCGGPGGGIDPNYLGFAGWDTGVKALTDALGGHGAEHGTPPANDPGIPSRAPTAKMNTAESYPVHGRGALATL